MIKQRLYYILIVISIIIIVGLVFFFVSWKEQDKTEESNQTLYQPGLVPNLENENEITKLPKIVGEEAANKDILPSELAPLILDEVTMVNVSKLKFENGNIGYSIDYSINGDLTTINQKFRLILNSWKFVFGAYNETSAILERENLNYKIRVVITRQTGSLIDILITAVTSG